MYSPLLSHFDVLAIFVGDKYQVISLSLAECDCLSFGFKTFDVLFGAVVVGVVDEEFVFHFHYLSLSFCN
jgi:hypothetical protein